MTVLALSLKQVLETVTSDRGVRNATGTFASADTLLTPETTAMLDARFPGVYGIVFFHPDVDSGINAYLLTAAEQESGKDIYLLFPANRPVNAPVAPTPDILAPMRFAEDPLADVIFQAVPAKGPLQRPGVLVVRRMSELLQPVYVQLPSTSDASAAGTSLRALMAVIRRTMAVQPENEQFAQTLSLELTKAGFSFVSSAGMSFGEALVRFYRFLRANKSDIIALATVAV